AAIDMLLEFGIPNVVDRIARITARLIEGLLELGFQTLGPTSGENAAGIVTVSRPETDMEAVFEGLAAAHIVCSSRQNRQSRHFIRSARIFTTPKPKWTRS